MVRRRREWWASNDGRELQCRVMQQAGVRAERRERDATNHWVMRGEVVVVESEGEGSGQVEG
jgi:hypothetical protein